MGGRSAGTDALGSRLRKSIALLVLLLAACGGNRDNVASPQTLVPSDSTLARIATSTTLSTSSTASTGAPPTTGNPPDDIIARYVRFWEVRVEANRDPVNPADPRLADLATGKQLENVRAETSERLAQGLAFRIPEPSVATSRVKVIEVVGDTATLRECVVNDGIVYRISDGQVVDAAVVTRNVTATMQRADGVWRLAEARVLQKWEGVAGCAKSQDF